MLVVMQAGTPQHSHDAVLHEITQRGFQAFSTVSAERTVIAAVGATRSDETLHALAALPGVEKVAPIAKPYKLASRMEHRERTVVNVQGIRIGDPHEVVVMAGPCTVENRAQAYAAACAVKAAGARILRGGAFKPRTSPYSFQGLAENGLKFCTRLDRNCSSRSLPSA